MMVAITTCLAEQPPATAPRVTINLPDNVPANAVWIRYALYGKNGGRIERGDTLKLAPAVRHFDVVASLGEEARIVVYAPGCRFAVYDVTIEADVVEQFRCEPLPTKTVHGFINPKEIPSNAFSAGKRLDVTGYFTADWVCDLFLQPRRGDNIGGGSCLGSGMRLGTIGQLDPVDGGKFDITMPDFTRDPVFEKFPKHFGVIQLSLKEKHIDRTMVAIKAADTPESGLNIQSLYRDPVVFTRIRR
jgi:hypothetical protein